MYIVKLDLIGSFQWNKTIGGIFGDEAYSMTNAIDGGYVLAGFTGSFGIQNDKMYIVKLDANGNTCGNTTTPIPTITTPTPTVTTPTPFSMIPTPVITTPIPTVSSGGTETTICTTVGINNRQAKIPSEFKLYQNYPNPFNPVTKIKFEIASSANVTIKIYDILGREVTTILNNEYKLAGTYEVEWNGSNFASGVYLYKISAQSRASDFVSVKKMVLLK